MKRLLLFSTLLLAGLMLLVGAAPAVAQSGNPWRVDYFNNPDWAGAPVTTEYVPFASFDWAYGSPSGYIPADNFTARLTTDAYFYSGNYTFSIVADDEFVLLVDGAIRFDSRGKGQSGKSATITLPTGQGVHHIEVMYREWSQTAYLYVNWVYAGGSVPPPAPPPGPKLPTLPPSAASLKTKFGDFTPCLKQGIHQSNCFVSDGAWDSPNLGSIQMEQPIQSWVSCDPPDKDQTFYVSPREPSKDFRCSKTMAGWFPK